MGAIAKGMSVSISFRLQAQAPAVSRRKPPVSERHSGSGDSSPTDSAPEKGEPKMMVSNRAVVMETLDLEVKKSGYSMVVNALAYLFSDLLKEYACKKIAKHLDTHTGTLIETL